MDTFTSTKELIKIQVTANKIFVKQFLMKKCLIPISEQLLHLRHCLVFHDKIYPCKIAKNSFSLFGIFEAFSMPTNTWSMV